MLAIHKAFQGPRITASTSVYHKMYRHAGIKAGLKNVSSSEAVRNGFDPGLHHLSFIALLRRIFLAR